MCYPQQKAVFGKRGDSGDRSESIYHDHADQ